jgi:hypothetical protein
MSTFIAKESNIAGSTLKELRLREEKLILPYKKEER